MIGLIVVEDSWMMFNDFLVRSVPEEEVFTFTEWKVPAIVIFERVDSDIVLDYSAMPSQLDPGVLFKDVSVAW